MKLFLTLRHEGKWIAEGSGFRISGNSLDELDRNVADFLRKNCYRGKIEVHMSFDYSTFPHWMLQFHPCYFSRTVLFDIDPEVEEKR